MAPLNCQSRRVRDVYRHYSQPSGDFRQNCQFRQNLQPPKGHFGHPIQIASNCGEIANFGKNRQKWQKWQEWRKSPASGDLNWMPKVAPWRLAILANLAILAEIARGLSIMAINLFITIIVRPLAIFLVINDILVFHSLQDNLC